MLKKTLPFLCCLVFLFAALRIDHVSSASVFNASESPGGKELTQDGNSLTEQCQIAEAEAQVLSSDEAIQYYAYLNLDAAEDDLRPIIIAARNKIIYRHSWVADEVYGEILDQDGDVKEVLPHFSDLFPTDWEVPVESQELDLSYYA